MVRPERPLHIQLRAALGQETPHEKSPEGAGAQMLFRMMPKVEGGFFNANHLS
jgi:hypothetical protein